MAATNRTHPTVKKAFTVVTNREQRCYCTSSSSIDLAQF